MTIAIQAEEVKTYRIKFVLEDGRKVYTSRRGQIDQKTAAELSILNMTNIAGNAAYSNDLSLFTADYRLLEAAGVPYTMVKEVVTEDAAQPLDPEPKTQ